MKRFNCQGAQAYERQPSVFALLWGHTDGALAFLIAVPDGNKSIIAAMHSGIETNTLAKDYLNKHGLPFSNSDIFREGLHSLMEEHVDLVLGNHLYLSDTAENLKKVMAGQSFLDAEE